MELHTKPLFSIIVPTYNHAHLINKCLDSIIAQSYGNFEVLVINNYSEDNTIERVEAYKDSRIKLINFKNNGIIGASRNVGIRNSIGDWICFLDSDDWWYPEKLTESKKHFCEADIIYHDLDWFKNGKKVFYRKAKGRLLNKVCIKDLIINGNAIPNSSVVVRRSIVSKVGFLSERKELFAVEDADYWTRIAAVTEKFCYLPISLGAYYIGNNNSVSEKQIEREMALFNEHKSHLSIEENNLAEKNLSLRIARIYHKLGIFDKAIILYKKAFTNQRLKRSIKIHLLISLSIIKFKI